MEKMNVEDVEMRDETPGMLSNEETASLPGSCPLGPEPSPEGAVATGALVPHHPDPTTLQVPPDEGSPAMGGQHFIGSHDFTLSTTLVITVCNVRLQRDYDDTPRRTTFIGRRKNH